MNSSEQIPVRHNDEIDVIAAIALMWRYKYPIIAGAFFLGISAIVYALLARPLYKANVAIIQMRSSAMSGTGMLASQFSGLASLVGLSGSLGNDPGLEAQAVLASYALAEEFVRRENLVATLSANTKSGSRVWFAVKAFREQVLLITQDKDTGITTVEIKWPDPAVAARLANAFVSLANEHMRKHAIADSSRNIAYLEQQIDKTNSLELQRVMYDLIESETKTLMLAKGRTEYAFAVVDPAVPPEMRSSPKRTLIAVTGTALGGILAAALAFAHNAWRRHKLTLSVGSGR